MLILVVVSVSLVINSGLIGKTREAGETTTEAYRNEAHYGEQAQITIGGVTYNSIAEYEAVLNGEANPGGGEDPGEDPPAECEHEWGAWTSNASTGKKTRTCTKCSAVDEEWDLVIGANLSGYNPTIGPNNETINTSYTVPVGELDDELYEVVTQGCGYDGQEQVFTVKDSDTWKILGVENGQILIEYAGEIRTDDSYYLYFDGPVGIASCINELNNICSIYGQGKYADTSKYKLVKTVEGNKVVSSQNESGARSITLADLERLGYSFEYRGTSGDRTMTINTNDSGKILKLNSTSTTYGSVFWYYDYFDVDNSNPSGEFHRLGNSDSVTLGRGIWFDSDDGCYNYDSSHTADLTTMGLTGTYYFADYYLGDFSSTWGHVSYGIPYMGDNIIYGGEIYRSDDCMAGNADAGIRPVVYLQSNIELSYNSTTNTYTIVE